MRRRAFLCLVLAASCARPNVVAEEPERAPLTLGPGPHLFIDDYLIGEQSFLRRTVNNPKKHPAPVIPGGDAYRIYQPFVSAARDAQTGIFRMCYEVPRLSSRIADGPVVPRSDACGCCSSSEWSSLDCRQSQPHSRPTSIRASDSLRCLAARLSVDPQL